MVIGLNHISLEESGKILDRILSNPLTGSALPTKYGFLVYALTSNPSSTLGIGRATPRLYPSKVLDRVHISQMIKTVLSQILGRLNSKSVNSERW